MDINMFLIQEERRVNMGKELETLVIDISKKFFLNVAQYACLMWPDEDGRVGVKKKYHSIKFTF